MKDTGVPHVFVSIAYCLIGFLLCYLLGLKIGFGVTGIWIGLSIGMNSYTGLLILRFRQLTNRIALQDQYVDRVSHDNCSGLQRRRVSESHDS